MAESERLCGNENIVARDVVNKLDKWLYQLDGFKPLLEQSAKFTANEIMMNFDAVINVLCDRRESLLDQLRHLVNNKCGYIESQKRIVETLRTGVLKCVSAGSEIDQQLRDCVKSSEDIAFSTESVPFVSFASNIAHLYQAIAAYGQIITGSCNDFAEKSAPLTYPPLEVKDTMDGRAENIETRPYMDPSIRKWLLNSNVLISEKLPCDYGLVGKNEKVSNTAVLAPSHPTYDLHTWLDQTKRPVKCFRRKLSNSFTTVDSDYSESHPPPANSNVGGKLKEWLLPDCMDTGDTPESSSIKMHSSKPNDIEDLCQWLLPPEVKPTEQMPLLNIGGDGFTQADLAGDLVYVGDSANKSSEVASIVSLNSVDLLPTTITSQGCPISAVKEARGSYDCIYSQCCGGPGGPTCCGGRSRPVALATSLNSSVKATVGLDTSDTVQSDASFLFDSVTSHATTQPQASELPLKQRGSFAVVDQLANIAKSGLQLWHATGCNNICSEQSKKGIEDDKFKMVGPYETSKWLVKSTPDTGTNSNLLPLPGNSDWDSEQAVMKSVTHHELPHRDYEGWLSTKLATSVGTA